MKCFSFYKWPKFFLSKSEFHTSLIKFLPRKKAFCMHCICWIQKHNVMGGGNIAWIIMYRICYIRSLTVGLPEIWNILEIQKMKICSEVRNFIGKMNFWSKYAEVSWSLRYSVFSVFPKISWPIFPSKLRNNWAGYNFFGDIPGFGLLYRFQK